MTPKASNLLKRLKPKKLPQTSGLLVLLVGFLLWQGWANHQLRSTVKTLAEVNENVIVDMGKATDYISDFGSDLNEIRQYLLLSTRDYSFNQIEEEAEKEESQDDPVVVLFSYLDTLGQNQQKADLYSKNETDLTTYLESEATQNLFSSVQLTLQKGLDNSLVDENGTGLLRFKLNDDGTFSLNTYQEPLTIQPDNFESFKGTLEAFIMEDLDQIKIFITTLNATRSNVFNTLSTDESFRKMIAGKKLIMEEERETDDDFRYEFKNNVATAAWLQIRKMDGEIAFNDKTIKGEWKTALMDWLEDYDGRTELEKQIQTMRTSIEGLKEDQGFQSLLQKYGFQFSAESIETENEIQYELKNSQGEVIQLIIINKATAELMIKAPGADTGSLLSSLLDAEQKKLTLPDTISVESGIKESQDEINILVAGKHSTNTDTLMVANIDVPHQKITLVSIPRDLYHEGRKINSVYADYGMQELTRRLSEIIGRKIDQYILVDMYVFRDLIDLVDGIDVQLEKDLRDPTYKVMENGIASTLYYPAGKHHINGTEALRIARSRHTSSDYSRAERQQLILEGIQDKAKQFGFGDAPTVIKLIKTVLEKTETNIPIEAAVGYYFRYQGFELNRGYVLSSGNVLDSAKIPVNFNTSLQIDVCNETSQGSVCTKKNAIYALVPHNQNWDYIKWYFQEILTN